MLFTLGERTRSNDVVDLLLGCHQRMREHLALARRLANAPAATAAENIRAAADRVSAYFTIAFPLHCADEEEDIFPALLGQNENVDAAIAELVRDHGGHQAHVTSVLEICEMLGRDPLMLGFRAAELADELRLLEQDLLAHTRLEERTVFPAIARLPAEDRELIFRRMRTRRGA